MSVIDNILNRLNVNDTVRHFWLENSDGLRLDLLGEFNETPWLYQPDGLGWGKSVETVESTNLSIITKINESRPNFTGTFFFKDYAQFIALSEFIEFGQINEKILENTKNCLKLYYQTVDKLENEYFYIYFTDINKGEKEEDSGILLCDFSAVRVSNLRSDIIQTAVNYSGTPPPPTFALPTEGSDLILFTDQITNEINFSVNNFSAIKIPVKIEFQGAFSNPTWTNLSNGLEGGYFAASSDGTLVIDANIPEQIIFNGVESEDLQDHTKFYNFLFLKPGVNELRFKVDEDVPEAPCLIRLSYTRERLA